MLTDLIKNLIAHNIINQRTFYEMQSIRSLGNEASHVGSEKKYLQVKYDLADSTFN